MKKKLLPLLLISALLCTLLPGQVLPVSAAASVTYSLPVFETTDVHGHLVDTSTADPATYQYRLASIGKVINDARVNGDRDTTVVLDGGDIYQGNVVSNLNHGEPMVAAYDVIGYDAVALGNHEFDWDVTTLCDPDGTMTGYHDGEEYFDCEIPVLANNIYYAGTQTRVNFTQDYVILDKTAVASNGTTKDVKVAVIGFAENYSSSIMPTKIAPYTIKFDSTSRNAVKTLAASLKTSGQADAVILLSHWDATDAEPYFEGSEIDLILGGHSHQTQYSGSTDVPYLQAGAKAGAYGKATLNFTGDTVTVTNVGTHTPPTNTASYLSNLEPAVYAISQDAIASIQAELSDVLGYVTRTVSGQTAGNFVCDLYNRGTGALVSVTNSGGIRTTFKLRSGETTRDITVGDIYTMMPFDNHLFVYQVTCAELFDAIRRDTLNYIYGVDWYPNALVINGTCVYKDGVWLGNWATREVLVSVNEYVATINDIYLGWAEDGKLIDDVSYIDNVTMISALREISEENDGYIPTDTENHRHTSNFTGTLECTHSSLSPVAGVAPTCTADGSLACYSCDFCGANFADANAQTHLPDITIPALGHSYTESCVCDNCGEAFPLEPETVFLPTDTISAGDEIVILDASDRALSSEQYSTYTQLKAKTVTVNAKVITAAADDLVFRVETAAGGTYRFVSGGKYLTGTAQSKLTMEDTASDYSRWYLIENEDGFAIQNYKAVSSKKPLYLEYYSSRYTMYTAPTTQYFYAKTSLHDFDDGAVTTPATCNVDGILTYTCSGCGATKTEVIPALGTHSYGSAQPLDKYSHSFTCTFCGDTYSEAHTFVNGICTACGADEESAALSNLFEKVMTAPADWSGDYVIVTSYDTADAALANTMTKSGELDAKTVTVTDNSVTTGDTAIIWTLEAAGNSTYRIYNAAGYLKITGTGSTNAAITASCEDTFTIEGSSSAGVFRIVSVANPTRCFSYYTGSGTFRTYAKSGHTTGYLFRRSAPSVPLSIDSAALVLNGKIDVIYTATVPDGYTDARMVFEMNTERVTVTDDGTGTFTFTGINPQCMGDTISATLYATKNGTEESVSKTDYSVRQYCVNQLAKAEDEDLITLLSDLLTYGAAAQIYMNYKTGSLVTDDLDLMPSSYTALSGLAVSFSGTAASSVCWTGASLTLTDSVAMVFRFCAESTNGLTVKVTLNGRTEEYTAFTDLGNGLYAVSFAGISATEFADTVSASFFRNSAQVGNTVSYSVNTYVCAKQADGNAALAALVRALYCYGTSAAAYTVN